MGKVWIYARVSTIDKQDLDTQLLPLKEYAKQRGRETYGIYTDKISGSKEKRQWLDKLMDDAFKRKFDVVLVFRFDRMSRSTKHLINTLETFRQLWIDFVSYNESVDTSTPAWQMMFTMISAFAEFEKNIIVERVRAGLDRAKKQGKKLGRPRKQIDTERILSLRLEGLSYGNISKQLNISKSMIGRVLTR